MRVNRNLVLGRLGKRLRALRTKNGLSQEKLGFRAELDRTYIGGIERGERNVSLLNLVRISRALGVRLPDLLSGIAD